MLRIYKMSSEIIQEKPKINEETYNDLMEKSRVEFPGASEWILHVAVTNHLMRKKKGFKKDNKLIQELKDNYFKDFEFKGLEIKEESREKNIIDV